MARPKRKKMKFTEESMNDLLQEIYNDSHNIKSKIARLFTKWESKVKEGGEVQAIGDQIVKLIAAEAKNQDQKIVLLRYLKEVVFSKDNVINKVNNEEDDDNDVGTLDRKALISMVNEELDKKKKTNKSN